MTAKKTNYQRNEKHIAELAIGRIFRIMSRPYRDGDVEQYHRCRSIVMEITDQPKDRTANYARDRLKGAAGD